MFYSEEDVQPAVTMAVELFGRQGNMLYTATWKNFCVMTKQFGKIWYGDINLTSAEVTAKCRQLSQKLGQKVYILPDGEYANVGSALEFSN
jgi:hypothetical protein